LIGNLFVKLGLLRAIANIFVCVVTAIDHLNDFAAYMRISTSGIVYCKNLSV